MKNPSPRIKYFSALLRKIVAVFFFIIAFPIILIFALLVFFELKESPFFIQKRGMTIFAPFNMIKIKTVKTRKLARRINSQNVFIKDELKESVPFICSILRRTGLDELPQLINVIKGEMNFIGPRPLPWEDVVFMRQNEPTLHERRKAVKSKPGITGLWQLFGVKEKGIENLVELEEFYDTNKSFKLNFVILLNTLPKVLFAKHQDSILGKKKLKFILTEDFKRQLSKVKCEA